jgi:lysophospholipase L1-like esterase
MPVPLTVVAIHRAGAYFDGLLARFVQKEFSMSHDRKQPGESSLDRRTFLATSTGLTAAGLAALALAEGALAQSAGSQPDAQPNIRPGDVVLFQGDSITDSGRNRDQEAMANSQPAMGWGYAWLAASQLLIDRPDDNLQIFNRGISGNKVFQLDDRWQQDCLDLKPNVLSILIGVNDFWHKQKHNYPGTVEIYQHDLRELLDRTKTALPETRIVICEPFVLKVGVVDDSWIPEFAGYRAASRQVADDSGAVFVPFQAMFDAAAEIAPPEHWAQDGVHPTPQGAALMAHWWLAAVTS